MSQQDTKEQLEADLQSAMRNLRVVMETTSGCGDRAQCYIDTEVKKVNIIRLKLGLKAMIAPRSTDDGSFGFSSGLALLVSNYE